MLNGVEARMGEKGRGRMGREERTVRGPWEEINLRKRRVIKPSENRCSQKFKKKEDNMHIFNSIF